MKQRQNMPYLLQLQQQSRLYLTSTMVLTFFIVVCFCLYQSPWQPQRQGAMLWQSDGSDEAVAQQQVPEQQEQPPSAAESRTADGAAGQTEPASEGAESGTSRDNTAQMAEAQAVPERTEPSAMETEQTEVAEPELSATEPDRSTQQTPQVQTVDLLQLQAVFADFTAPCSGAMLYGYGVGYDPICADYRFHDAVCYQADGSDVLAVTAGVVQQTDMQGDWQMMLRCGDYQLRYRGLQSCTVAAGDMVTAGQIVGTAGEALYVQAVKAE